MMCLAFSARHGAAQRQRTSTMLCSAMGRASSPSLEHKCILSLPAAFPSPPSIGNGNLPTCSCRGETELVVVPAPPPGQQRASRLSSAVPCPIARMLLRRDTSPYGGRNIRRGGWQLLSLVLALLGFTSALHRQSHVATYLASYFNTYFCAVK
jgi:hypothetical protein